MKTWCAPLPAVSPCCIRCYWTDSPWYKLAPHWNKTPEKMLLHGTKTRKHAARSPGKLYRTAGKLWEIFNPNTTCPQFARSGLALFYLTTTVAIGRGRGHRHTYIFFFFNSFSSGASPVWWIHRKKTETTMCPLKTRWNMANWSFWGKSPFLFFLLTWSYSKKRVGWRTPPLTLDV